MKTNVNIEGISFEFDDSILKSFSAMTCPSGTKEFEEDLLCTYRTNTGLNTVKEGLQKYSKEELTAMFEQEMIDELKFMWGDNWSAVI